MKPTADIIIYWLPTTYLHLTPGTATRNKTISTHRKIQTRALLLPMWLCPRGIRILGPLQSSHRRILHKVSESTFFPLKMDFIFFTTVSDIQEICEDSAESPYILHIFSLLLTSDICMLCFLLILMHCW